MNIHYFYSLEFRKISRHQVVASRPISVLEPAALQEQLMLKGTKHDPLCPIKP